MSDQIPRFTSSNLHHNPHPSQVMDACNHSQCHPPPPVQQHVTMVLPASQIFIPMSSQNGIMVQDDNAQSVNESLTGVDEICEEDVRETILEMEISNRNLASALEQEKASKYQLEEQNGRLTTELQNAKQLIWTLNSSLLRANDEVGRLKNEVEVNNSKFLTSNKKLAETRKRTKELEKQLEEETKLNVHLRRKEDENLFLQTETQVKSTKLTEVSAALKSAIEHCIALENDKINLEKGYQSTEESLKNEQEKYDSLFDTHRKDLEQFEMHKLLKADELANTMGQLNEGKRTIDYLSCRNEQLSTQVKTIIEQSQQRNSKLYKLVDGIERDMQSMGKRGASETEGGSSKKMRNDEIFLVASFGHESVYGDMGNGDGEKKDGTREKNGGKENDDGCKKRDGGEVTFDDEETDTEVCEEVPQGEYNETPENSVASASDT